MPFDLFHHSASYSLLRQDGLQVDMRQALRTKRYVILYIASHWWAPCRGVTAQLCNFYRQHHDALQFEVIFLSTDRSKDAMLGFFHGSQGDWLCLDYDDARALEVELAGDPILHPKQVPACLVFELDTGAMLTAPVADSAVHGRPSQRLSMSSKSLSLSLTPTLSYAQLTTTHGREMLSRDKEAALFPWYDDGWRDADSHRRSAVAMVTSNSAAAPLPRPAAVPHPAARTAPTEAAGLQTNPHKPLLATPAHPPLHTPAAPHEASKPTSNSVPKARTRVVVKDGPAATGAIEAGAPHKREVVSNAPPLKQRIMSPPPPASQSAKSKTKTAVFKQYSSAPAAAETAAATAVAAAVAAETEEPLNATAAQHVFFTYEEGSAEGDIPGDVDKDDVEGTDDLESLKKSVHVLVVTKFQEAVAAVN